MTDMARVVHVSADFPDSVDSHKTQAIRSLIELTSGDFENSVISLNRKPVEKAPFAISALRTFGKPHLLVEQQGFGEGEALIYRAPGRGIFHRTMLVQLGQYLAEEMRRTGVPALIVGHKMTVEGIAVAVAAAELGCPYALTIQGDTDTKILNARPDLAPVFRRVFHGASMVVSFAPWSLAEVEAKLGKRSGPTKIIPCPTELDQPIAPVEDREGLLSVFHLKNYKRKNLPNMAKSLALLDQEGRQLSLAIVGGGSVADQVAAKKTAGDGPGVIFEGPLEREDIAQRMNQSAGFVLPSKRETFGLVFIEALFAGCPVIYPEGQAIEGYFEDCPFAISVPPGDVRKLAGAMAHLTENQNELKNGLAKWQLSEEAQRFTRVGIARDYSQALRVALGGSE